MFLTFAMEIFYFHVEFNVLVVVTMKCAIFWVVRPCILEMARETYCLHLQGQEGAEANSKLSLVQTMWHYNPKDHVFILLSNLNIKNNLFVTEEYCIIQDLKCS
jgi:hypothetical protein